jgi:signal transduction histidine kinase
MSKAFRCAECGSRNHVFEALNESLLALSSELSADVVLRRIVEIARHLVHASYGAVGVRHASEGFSHFITSTEAASHRVPPEVETILAGVLSDPEPYVTTDIQADPRFGGWPPGHPDLKSFLGVPILAAGEIIGAFYIGNENTWGFKPEDKDLVELLAPHAGLAIKNVRLYEQTRELSVTQERNRLARELHDSVTQTLFSMRLAAESASVLVESNPQEARAQLDTVQELARSASSEMRSLIFELRPPELEIEGLVATLARHIDVLRRIHDVEIDLHHRGDAVLEATQEREVFRVVQEALNNAIRHSGARHIAVEIVTEEAKIRASVADDGVGFDPGAPRRSRRLGLVSMEERAHALDGELSISSAPGDGTVVALEVTR